MGTRYFYDTEFVEDGVTIDLVSIGIMAEDGREFYGVSSEFDQAKLLANPWLRDNVWFSLPKFWHAASDHCDSCKASGPGHLDLDATEVRSRTQLAKAVNDFLVPVGTEFDAGETVELWADYGAYDHIALCQLFGSMMALPAGLPMFTRDIQQEAARLGVPWDGLPQQAEGNHNALADARHCKARFDFLASRR